MKLGAERKKIVWLVGLLVVAGLVYWMNSTSDAPSPSAPRPAVDPSAALPSPGGPAKSNTRRMAQGTPTGLGGLVFEAPVSVDPTKVDPTLRLDLLAKLQAVEAQGGERNIFKREAAPPEKGTLTAGGGPIPSVPGIPIKGPQPPPKPDDASTVKPAVAPPPPGAPPISLKYYGFARKRSNGEKKAFFLDGEDVIVATEGEIIKKQYKVVRITDNSVQMEDTGSKSTQTLPIQEVAPV